MAKNNPGCFDFSTGSLRSPFLCSGLSSEDCGTLMRQMGARRFDPSVALGVVRRCRWGYPQILLCRPLTGYKPFPTSFWLSCPHLDHVCGMRESDGGVRELEEVLEGCFADWARYHMLHVLLRFQLLGASRSRFLFRFHRAIWRALRSGGVGGIRLRERVTVKCLHLQSASWLSLGFHPGSSWLEKEIAPLDCDCPADFPCGGVR